ncbi:unnamed protein product, partial [Staurois parvus]
MKSYLFPVCVVNQSLAFSALAPWDALWGPNASSRCSHGPPRSSVWWKSISPSRNPSNCNGTNQKTISTTPGSAKHTFSGAEPKRQEKKDGGQDPTT